MMLWRLVCYGGWRVAVDEKCGCRREANPEANPETRRIFIPGVVNIFLADFRLAKKGTLLIGK